MSETLFFRFLVEDDKGASLAGAVDMLRAGTQSEAVYSLNPGSFCQIPRSPFAYWVSDYVRRLFATFPSFQSEVRTVRQGLATADDFRFAHAWWEVSPETITTGTMASDVGDFRSQTFAGRRWTPMSKGGSYSSYYADLHLVVDWEQDGARIRNFKDPLTGKLLSRPQNVDYYFRPGLTYPLRLHRLAVMPLPSGSIISVRGSGIYVPQDQLATMAGLFSSTAFDFLAKVMLGRFEHPQYDMGTLCITPIPPHVFEQGNGLAHEALQSIALKRHLDTTIEISHLFSLPALLQAHGSSLVERSEVWAQHVEDVENELDSHQAKVDDVAFQLYGIQEGDRRAIEESLRQESQATATDDEDENDRDDDAESEAASRDLGTLVTNLLSYALGCTFGRWDVRLATGQYLGLDLPDPFAPLPACSPGMLTGEDGLPLQKAPPGYSLRIDPDGILPDDPDHSEDIVRRVREVLELLWKDRAEGIEGEVCSLLGVKDLRDYFRNPTKGFFDTHIKKYSKSRRKAPIYWLLQSPRKLYGLWVYYHRLDGDLLYKALTNYVEPKIARESNRLEELQVARNAAGAGGQVAKGAERAIDRQEALLSDLREFRDRLAAAANLRLVPDHNDGVLLTIAPLHEVVPWKEARTAWEELTAGKYGWSTMGQQLQARGLVKETARGART